MSKTILGVIVKNKLGWTFGNRGITVRENDLDTAAHSVSPGAHVPVPSTDEQVPLRSLDIQALDPVRAAAESKIPIRIDSPGDYDISLKQDAAASKWRLEFKTRVGRLSESKDEGGPPVNVSVGQDEPPAPLTTFFSLRPSTMIFCIPIAWVVSRYLLVLTPIGWVVIPIVSFIGGIISWLLGRKKQQENDQ
jgi:hypothetical protein